MTLAHLLLCEGVLHGGQPLVKDVAPVGRCGDSHLHLPIEPAGPPQSRVNGVEAVCRTNQYNPGVCKWRQEQNDLMALK